MSSQDEALLIKRYRRSRLYDTKRGRYVAVSQLREWQRRDIPFVVIDMETGQDITRILLA